MTRGVHPTAKYESLLQMNAGRHLTRSSVCIICLLFSMSSTSTLTPVPSRQEKPDTSWMSGRLLTLFELQSLHADVHANVATSGQFFDTDPKSHELRIAVKKILKP